MLDVDCDIVGGDWDDAIDWAGLATSAVAAALIAAGADALVTQGNTLVEVSVRLTDDSEMQRLNLDYRGKDKPTNVLSFAMHDIETLERWIAAGETDLLLGDLVLGYETVRREADEKRIGMEAHVVHLLVHGTLHLLGHDHQDDVAASAMEALEARILAGLGVSDPYVMAQRAIP